MPAVLQVVIVRSARDRPSSFKAGFGVPFRICRSREPSPAARITASGGVFDPVSGVGVGERFNDLSRQFYGRSGNDGRSLAEVGKRLVRVA